MISKSANTKAYLEITLVYKIYPVPKLRYPSSRENKSKPTVYLFTLINVYMLACSTLPFLVGLYKYVP